MRNPTHTAWLRSESFIFNLVEKHFKKKKKQVFRQCKRQADTAGPGHGRPTRDAMAAMMCTGRERRRAATGRRGR